MKTLGMLIVVGLSVPTLIFAQNSPQYGAFTAIHINEQAVQDVLVEDDDVYVKMAPAFQNAEIIVRISDANARGYRKWEDGEADRIVKAYRSIAFQKKKLQLKPWN